MVYEIIPIKLGRMSSPTNPLNNQDFFIAQALPCGEACCFNSDWTCLNSIDAIGTQRVPNVLQVKVVWDSNLRIQCQERQVWSR